MSAGRTILAAFATLGLSLAAAPVAQASLTYGQVGSFGGEAIQNPFGVAVDQASDHVYVSSIVSADRLAEFGAAGNILEPSPFGQGEPLSGEYIFSGVAVDPREGNLYVVEGLGQEIQTYSGVTGALLSHFSVAGSANLFESITAVQIASDGIGDIYFPNAPNDEVQELSPEGILLKTFVGSGSETLKAPTGVAVSPAGDVYVADNGNGRVEELTPAGTFVMAIGTGVDETTGAAVCTAASGDTCGPGSDGSEAVALDAAGDILVGENSGAGYHVVVYNSGGEELADFGLGAIGPSEFETIDTLAVGPTGLVYVTDAASNLVLVYAQQRKPTLLSTSSSVVRQTTATINAAIVPGYAETTYRLEYGLSTSYGRSVPIPDSAIGDGGPSDAPVNVGQELTGLQPATTYHYRVVATNSVGQTIGPDETFTTLQPQPPVLSTGQATGTGQNGATLTATIDTEGYETIYEFDLGVDTSYGTRIFGDAGSQPGAQTFATALQGLMPETTYHYRIAATNPFGTVYGADQTFTTAGYPTATLAVPQSPPLLPTSLLAPAPRKIAKVAVTKLAASKVAATKRPARSARRGADVGSGRHRKSGRRSGGHTHGNGRRGKR